MTQKLYKAGRVILGWIIANLLGIAASSALALIFSSLMSVRGMLVSSLIIGVPIGFAQWIALRRIAPISMLWAITISLGLFLGLVVVNSPISGVCFFFEDESVLSLTAAYMIIGLLIGLAQWLFLRGYFTRSLIWPLSSTAGLGLGFGLVLASNLIHQSGIISFILVFLVYTVVTGLAKLWLPISHGKTESNPVNTT